jgi:alpha-beta hydrolase superfamily lysophospholipase
VSERVASLRSITLNKPELVPIRLEGSVEEAELRTSDGVTLSARWWRRPGRAKAAVVLVHGFGASKDDAGIRALAADLHGEGFDVLTYDARGHGRSEGHCTVGGEEQKDVAAAASLAAVSGQPVVLVGVSMGAIAVLSHAASPAPIAGVVVVSAPARWRMSPSLVGLAIVGLTRTRLGSWFMRRRLGVRVGADWRLAEPPVSIVGRIGAPIAVVHGRRDRLIRSGEARLLFEGAHEPRRLDVVSGMGHGIDEHARAAVLASLEWLMDSRASDDPPESFPGDSAGESL